MKKLITICLVLIVYVVLTNNAQGVIVDSNGFPVIALPYEMDNGPIYYPLGSGINIWIESCSAISKNPGSSLPPQGESWHVDSFFDVFTELSLDGGGTSTIESFFDVFTELSIDGGPEGSYQTEILSMNLSGDFAGIPIFIRESPTMPSLGQHIVDDLGGGQFHIDSFFDVFTELSVDGGYSWVPASGPMHMSVIPEPTTIALFSLGALSLIRRKSNNFIRRSNSREGGK